MQLVVVVHVLAEHEREAVDEVLHGGRGYVEDADATFLGEDELAAGRRSVVGWRFRLAVAHLTSSATTSSSTAGSTSAAGADTVVTCARSARSRYHGRSLIHAGATLP